jgi:hypothetical protein
MAQGIIIWVVTLIISYLLIGWVTSAFRNINKQFLTILFFYHSLLALAYYGYTLFNFSDSKGYFGRIWNDTRGDTWGSYYGTSTTFIEFFGYPFVKYMGFTYESMMVLFSFFGFLGFLFFYILFRERVTLRHRFLSVDLLTLIFFLPNFHFWTSSFGKGALIFFGLALFIFGFSKPLSRIGAILVGGWIIFHVRPHVFYVVMVAVALGYTFSSKGNLAYRFVILALSVFMLYYVYDDILKITGLEDESILDPLISHRASELSKATSGIDITNYNFIQKMFAFWFRPLFFDAPGALGIIVSFENLFYLALFIYTMRWQTLKYLWSAEPIVKTCFLTFIGVSIALAQISGNLGLAMRQKSQVMILMLFVVMKFMDEQKIKKLRLKLKRKRQLEAMQFRDKQPVIS